MLEKIVETVPLQGWKVFDGEKMSPAKALHVTRPFQVWKIRTETREIECADDHFLFFEDGCKVMASELHTGDRIQVDGGIEAVVSIEQTDRIEQMYDMEMDTSEHKWSTNGIVSHNTTTCTAFILHYVLFNPDKKVAILANKGAQAREIMSRIELAYLHLPKWLQCGVKTWNKGSMELANGSSIISSTTSSDSIRGQSYSCVAEGTLVTLKDSDGNAVQTGIEHALKEKFQTFNQVLTPSGFQKYEGLRARLVDSILEVLFDDKTRLKCTEDHRIQLADGKFIEASSLVPDMEALSVNGCAKILNIKKIKRKTWVYDLLDVANGSVYWTDGIASHNCVLIDECLAGKETVLIRRKSDHHEMTMRLEDFWKAV